MEPPLKQEGSPGTKRRNGVSDPQPTSPYIKKKKIYKGFDIEACFDAFKEMRQEAEKSKVEEIEKHKKESVKTWRKLTFSTNGSYNSCPNPECGFQHESCKSDVISEVFLLYGCSTHGWCHQCDEEEMCNKASNLNGMWICPISGKDFGPYIESRIRYNYTKKGISMDSDESLSPVSGGDSDETDAEDMEMLIEEIEQESDVSALVMREISNDSQDDSPIVFSSRSSSPSSSPLPSSAHKKTKKPKSMNSSKRITEVITLSNTAISLEESPVSSSPSSPIPGSISASTSKDAMADSSPCSPLQRDASIDASILKIEIQKDVHNVPLIQSVSNDSYLHIRYTHAELLEDANNVIYELLYNGMERKAIDDMKVREMREIGEKALKDYMKTRNATSTLPVVQEQDVIWNKAMSSKRRVPVVLYNKNLHTYYASLVVEFFKAIESTPAYKQKYSNQNMKRRTMQHIQKLCVGILFCMQSDYVVPFKHNGNNYKIKILEKDMYISDNMYEAKDLCFVGKINLNDPRKLLPGSSKYPANMLTKGDKMLKQCVPSMTFAEAKDLVKKILKLRDTYKYRNEIKNYVDSFVDKSV